MQKQIIPRCEKCKKLYSASVEDGTGHCLKCRENEVVTEFESKKGEQSMNNNNENPGQEQSAIEENVVKGESMQSIETHAVVSRKRHFIMN
jgi:hypothetical protein